MAHALPSRQLAIEVHGLLADLDPARWRDDLEASARERLADIHATLTSLVPTAPSALWSPLEELRTVLMHYAPQEGVDDARRAWMEFRAACQPAYEAFAQALRAEGARHVPSLRPTNYVRNLYHVANSATIVAAVQVVLTTQARMVAVAAAGFTAAWSMELSRRRWPAINTALMRLFGQVAHPHETHRINSATWYTTALLILALGFSPEVGVAALAVLGLGDPAAALVGRRFGRIGLVGGRTLEGSLAFVAFGGLGALLALALCYPAPLAVMATRALVAAIAGAGAELLCRRIDDNLAIPVAAAIAGGLLQGVGG